MLYRAEMFEPLTETRWERGRVCDAIGAIVAEVERAYRGPDRLWPADPLSGSDRTDPVKNLYTGAAGTLFALDTLRRRGLAETRLDLAALARRALELSRAAPDFEDGVEQSEPLEASLLIGETGTLLVAWRFAPADDLADALHARVRANIESKAEDVMWGTPGTLLAAATMLDWTSDERWREAGRESAEALLARRGADGLWTQRLDGNESRGLGPIHGAVGNVQALARLVEPEVRVRLEHETARLLARTAVIEDGFANWPHAASADLGHLRWCAGAPGILASAAGYLDEELLLAAAAPVWHAGPQRMSGGGPCICCGTAGNGYALMKVFERTGDERWLERARRFAMHALEQVERDRARGGPGWYSLWQGDPGVALYAADCLDGRAVYPLFDADEQRE